MIEFTRYRIKNKLMKHLKPQQRSEQPHNSQNQTITSLKTKALYNFTTRKGMNLMQNLIIKQKCFQLIYNLEKMMKKQKTGLSSKLLMTITTEFTKEIKSNNLSYNIEYCKKIISKT